MGLFDLFEGCCEAFEVIAIVLVIFKLLTLILFAFRYPPKYIPPHHSTPSPLRTLQPLLLISKRTHIDLILIDQVLYVLRVNLSLIIGQSHRLYRTSHRTTLITEQVVH